jgi:hypothetical protein
MTRDHAAASMVPSARLKAAGSLTAATRDDSADLRRDGDGASSEGHAADGTAGAGAQAGAPPPNARSVAVHMPRIVCTVSRRSKSPSAARLVSNGGSAETLMQ